MHKDEVCIRHTFTIKLQSYRCFLFFFLPASEKTLSNGNASYNFTVISILYKNLTCNAAASYVQRNTARHLANSNKRQAEMHINMHVLK